MQVVSLQRVQGDLVDLMEPRGRRVIRENREHKAQEEEMAQLEFL